LSVLNAAKLYLSNGPCQACQAHRHVGLIYLFKICIDVAAVVDSFLLLFSGTKVATMYFFFDRMKVIVVIYSVSFHTSFDFSHFRNCL
jgi:hypothetical protein